MSYTETQLEKIWRMAEYISESSEELGIRKDMCGAWIQKEKFGKEDDFGWEVDHIFPKSKALEIGISEEKYNDIINLQPLHHKNNGPEGKGDNYPRFNSKIISKENINIETVKEFVISFEKQLEIKLLFSGIEA